MPYKLTGRDGQTVTIPDGGHGLQGSDGRMVAIPKGGHGLQGSDGRMVAIPKGSVFRILRTRKDAEKAPVAPPGTRIRTRPQVSAYSSRQTENPARSL
jgi:hypothetical protein